MSWLYETQLIVLIVLGIGVAGSLFAYSKNRSKGTLSAVVVSGVLLLLYLLIGALVDSEREKAEQSLRDMVANFKAGSLDEMFEHVDENFSWTEGQAGGSDKAALRRLADSAIRNWNVQNPRIWDLKVERFDEAKGEIVFSFNAKADVPGAPYPHLGVEATFVRGSDAKWRMKNYKLFKPGTTEQFNVPG